MSMIKNVGKGWLIASIACCAMQLQAATLQQCEKAKLKQLQAEQGARTGGGKKSKSAGKGPSKRRQSVDKLDEWLWKNCSTYSYELRRLEQERM